MNTIQKNASDQLNVKALAYMQEHEVDYRTAVYAVARTDGDLSQRYGYGENTVKRHDTMTAAQKAMAELVADPGKTMMLANFRLDELARQKLINIGKGDANPMDTYRRALSEVKQQYPNLARAAADGYITDTDYKLLGMLVPSVAREVEEGRYRQAESRCKCGERIEYCRGKKLARQRGINEADVKEFSACILAARAHGSELDALACYY